MHTCLVQRAVKTTTDIYVKNTCRKQTAFILILSFLSFSSFAQWSAIDVINFNGLTYQSDYATNGNAYWDNGTAAPAGPDNGLVNGTWDAINTNLGLTQTPSDAAGGRFLMYWSDGSYAGPVVAGSVFSKTYTGLTIGKTYRYSFKAGALSASNPSTLKVLLDGVNKLNVSTLTTSWATSSITFVATATSHTLSINNSNTSAGGNDLGLDNITLEINTVLMPVTFASFRAIAKDKTVQLAWVTATEQNNRGFDVQRSTDGIVWKSLGFVNGKSINNTSSSELNYAFTDMAPGSNNYYRLKQVDLDGNYAFSTICRINTNLADNRINVSNPVQNHVKIVTNTPHAIKTINLFDNAGHVVCQRNNNDNVQNSIDVSCLAKGIYLLQISFATGEMQVEKIVKN